MAGSKHEPGKRLHMDEIKVVRIVDDDGEEVVFLVVDGVVETVSAA